MISTPQTSSSIQSLHQAGDVLRSTTNNLQMCDSCDYQPSMSQTKLNTSHSNNLSHGSNNNNNMAATTKDSNSELLDVPQSRDRCNTWPRRQPDDSELAVENDTLLNEEIQEEDEDLDLFCDSNGLRVPQTDTNTPSPSNSDSSLTSGTPTAIAAGSKTRGLVSRRNAWGNMSYADLITQAIMSAPEQRMTLAQIYDWMVAQVAFFRDRGDNSSSAGWKNSIRHNLSLHSRFMRIQNEGAGKSSWWVLNPDAKPGKSSRRRAATVETSNKTLERKRGRVKKKVEQMRAMGLTGSQVLSPGSTGEENGDQFNAFRGRSDSTLSNYSTPASRLSPSSEVACSQPGDYHSGYWPVRDSQQSSHVPGELLDATVSMRLSNGKQQPGCYGPTAPAQRTCAYNNGGADSSSPIKVEPGMMPVKLEPINFCQSRGATDQLPSYQELYPSNQQMNGRVQNPMLREALQHQYNNSLTQPQLQQQQLLQPQMGMTYLGGCGTALPTSLPNDLSYESWQPMDVQCDIDQVLRHEMHVAGKVDFGNFDNL